MNLVHETLHIIKHYCKGKKIDWVGSRDGKYAMSWEEFKEKFKGLEYDSGFGSQHIAMDLVVVFDDGSWLEREEYDGAEHWIYKEIPIKKEDAKNFNVVGGNEFMWKGLEGIVEKDKMKESE